MLFWLLLLACVPESRRAQIAVATGTVVYLALTLAEPSARVPTAPAGPASA